MDTTLPDPEGISNENNLSPTVSVPADLDQLAVEVAELIDTVSHPSLLSPIAYIDEFIRTEVARTTISDVQKARITSDMKINVEYRDRYIPRPTSWLGSSNDVSPLKVATFELNQIVTDFFRHDLKGATDVRIRWPEVFPAGLRKLFETVNLQERYTHRVEEYFKRPNVKDLSLLLTRHEFDSLIRRYQTLTTASAAFKPVATAYLKGRAELQLVQFEVATKVNLERAVFLPAPDNFEDKTVKGLLVFLGNEATQQSVYEIPQDAQRFRELIERDADLRNQVLARIPLYHRLKPGNAEVKYFRRFAKSIGTFIWVAPITFKPTPDIGNDLFNLSYERLLSDIDTLVSTDAERFADSLLELSGYLLAGLSIVVTLPLSVSQVPGRIILSFLLGFASATTDATRARLEDLPQAAVELYRAAVISALAEVIGPLLQKMVGKVLSAVSRTKLANKFKLILNASQRPSSTTPYLIDALERSKNSAKLRKLELTLDADFKKGPQATQVWLENRGRFLQQFIAPYEVTVYRGFVFRGDLRNPDVIFKKGFKLRTPAAELQKDIHQATGVRGGFGGGHDALDIDGRGISTSVFYDKEHVGAFTYGGAKGGHTYLIDARKLDGYHLYANDFAARYPNSPPVRLSPVEINYATDIPPSAIVGAYDKNGVFIPNPDGLRRTARINQARLEQDLARRTFGRTAQETGEIEAKIGIDATIQLISRSSA